MRRFVLFLIALAGFSYTLDAQTVRFQTSLGGIDVVLTPDVTPLTVANFMNYVNSGTFNNTIIHRSLNAVNNSTQVFYLIQGGGFIVKNHLPFQFPPNDPVQNEYKASNVRGTLAMALYQNDINSGNDEWYFNTSDNSAALDPQTFTVFGKVADDASLAVMDNLNALPTFTLSGLADFPLNNYTPGRTVVDTNYVYVNTITPFPVASADGLVSAATFNHNTATGISPGEILTLFGQYLGPTNLAKLTVNSSGLVDTTIAGIKVLFNDVPGPMIFTSLGQLAVVVPYSLAGQSTVNVVVSSNGIQTSPMTFNVVPANPALFTLSSTGKGDAAIVRHNDASVVSATSPAAPGEVLELYGEGYGSVPPVLPDGALVGTARSVPATLLIDGNTVSTLYAGAAGGEINGMLQVNFAVPQIPAGTHQIQVKVGTATSPAGVTLVTR
jgi:uncharacterized protein (TIGR03437 family)